ncbi:MAG: SMC family ATPase, partial [Armatimonadota bacterium]|nr:SMC family ATPase [Armatimonadota bacterium]
DRVQRLRDAKEKLAKLETQLAPLKEVRARKEALDLAAKMQRQRDALVQNIALRDAELRQLSTQIADAQEAAARRKTLEEARERLESELAKAREELLELQNRIGSSRTRLQQSEKEERDLKEQLARVRQLGAQGKCPTCLRVLDDSFSVVVQRLEEQLRVLKDERQEYAEYLKEDTASLQQQQTRIKYGEAERQRLEAQMRAAAQAETRLTALLARQKQATEERVRWQKDLEEMGFPGYDAEEHRRVAARLNALEEVERQVIALQHEVERLPAEEEALRKARAAVPLRVAALQEAKEELEQLGFDQGRFEEQRDACERLEEEYKKRLQGFRSAEGAYRQADFERQEADRRREEYDQRLKEIEECRLAKENLDALVDLMQAFRLQLVGRVRPTLSAIASGLVRDLTDGKYDRVELDEDYDLWMYDGSERRKISSFSGGENDLAHLCLRLAISELIGQASGGAEHGFLILDEVLGSQDGERRSLILQALGRLSQRFRQILMITHVDDTKEMVEHVFELRETPGGSSVLVT